MDYLRYRIKEWCSWWLNFGEDGAFHLYWYIFVKRGCWKGHVWDNDETDEGLTYKLCDRCGQWRGWVDK